MPRKRKVAKQPADKPGAHNTPGGAAAKARVKIKLQAPDGTRAQYANFANVSRTPYDFELVFWRVPSISVLPSNTKVEVERTAEHVATLVLPYEVVRGLIKALQTTWSGFISDESSSIARLYAQLDTAKASTGA